MRDASPCCPDEVWPSVVGHEETYDVSSCGRVRSISRWVPSPRGNGRRWVVGRILKAAPSGRGRYRMVSLWTGGVQSPRKVHHLVAEAFLGPRPDGLEVCHGDGDPTNNHLWNLRYDTRAANSADTVRHGRCSFTGDGCCLRGHPLTGDNVTSSGGCKACHRARATVVAAARVGIVIDIDEEANEAYLRILTGSRRPTRPPRSA